MELVHLAIEELEVVHNYRKKFEVEDLLPSVQHEGIIQPIQLDQNKRIIGGHRRLKAAQELNLKQVPCIIKEVKNLDHLKYLGAIENLKRRGYRPSEEARAIADCKKYEQCQGSVTTRQNTGRGKKKVPGKLSFAEKLSEETGIAESTINRKARIGEKMSNHLAAALDDGNITEKQAEQLVRLERSDQDELLNIIKGKNIEDHKNYRGNKTKKCSTKGENRRCAYRCMGSTTLQRFGTIRR